MAYEEFKTAIKSVLVEAGKPLTWSEIKKRADLHQKVPNNRYVRQMEIDIGLVREKDKSGKILWRLK